MWKLILFILIAIFCLWKIYKSVIKPYFLYKFYKKQLKEKNYRLYADPFMPFAAPFIFTTAHDEKKFKDSYYTAKHYGPDYDLVLTNLAEKITLVLISPKLIQQFYLLDATKTYIK